MSETTTCVATNENAEKLFNCLIAYRNQTSKVAANSIEADITIGAIQLEEDMSVAVES